MLLRLGFTAYGYVVGMVASSNQVRFPVQTLAFSSLNTNAHLHEDTLEYSTDTILRTISSRPPPPPLALSSSGIQEPTVSSLEQANTPLPTIHPLKPPPLHLHPLLHQPNS